MSTVLCVGCWDIFHYGHLRHLEASWEEGSRLVVGVTRDRSIKKGAGRPLFKEAERKAIVQAIWCVDDVFLCDSSLEALRKVKPRIFSLGKEYRKKVLVEDFQFCDKHDIRIHFTNEPVMSSTALYARLRQGS